MGLSLLTLVAKAQTSLAFTRSPAAFIVHHSSLNELFSIELFIIYKFINFARIYIAREVAAAMVADNFTTLLSEALSNKTKDNSNRQQINKI